MTGVDASEYLYSGVLLGHSEHLWLSQAQECMWPQCKHGAVTRFNCKKAGVLYFSGQS